MDQKSNKKDSFYVITDDGADAIAYLPKFEIDPPTMGQIKKMLTHPAIVGSKVRIMPDCHRGTGCCIGFTYAMTEKIVPNFVGGDIGCGILTYNVGTEIFRRHSLKKIEKTIRNAVQMGNGHENIWTNPIVTEADLNETFAESQQQATSFCLSYMKKFGKDIAKHIPQYSMDWLKKKCLQVGAHYEADMSRCLGTLGGGNHYIEVNEDKTTGDGYITIHTGSRSFGSKICRHHQNKINSTRQFPYEEFNDKVKNINRKHKDSKVIKQLTDQLKSEIDEKKHTDYLENDEAYEYYMDMIFCQQYASLNRHLLLRSILNALNMSYDKSGTIESIHNYIDFNDFIVRKGAIGAHSGQKCIISLNMRDGIILCEGKGNENWNCTAPHGSGRAIPRGKATQSLNMKKFIKEMANVYTTSVSKDTLDESPMAYKDTEFIKSLLDPTVTILKQLTPVINLKAPN